MGRGRTPRNEEVYQAVFRYPSKLTREQMAEMAMERAQAAGFSVRDDPEPWFSRQELKYVDDGSIILAHVPVTIIRPESENGHALGPTMETDKERAHAT